MRNVCLIVFVVMLTIKGFSQDLVVTADGDSLNCKITKIKSDRLYFTFKHKNEIRSTLLLLNQVKAYNYDYFQIAEVEENEVIGNKDYASYRLSFIGGFSSRMAQNPDNISSDIEDYLNDLKTGYNVGIDFNYFSSESIGFGLKLNRFNSSAKGIDIYPVLESGGNPLFCNISDKTAITYIGPTFTTRLLDKRKRNTFITSIGFGYLGYKNTSEIEVYERLIVTGSTLGLVFDFGYDFQLSENILFGIQFSWIAGTITKVEVDNSVETKIIKLEKDEFESLNRFDLSTGFRFRF